MSDTDPTAEELAEQKRIQDLEKSKSTLTEKSTDELIDIIHSTRSEAKGYRLDLKGVKEEIEALKGVKDKEEQDKKIAEGKKDEVILELSEKLATVETKAKEWDSYNTKKRETIKTLIGDNWLDSFSVIPLSDLESLAHKFNGAKDAIDIDGGITKKTTPAKIEALRKDLALAIEKNDLPAQLSIKRMIQEEGRK